MLTLFCRIQCFIHTIAVCSMDCICIEFVNTIWKITQWDLCTSTPVLCFPVYFALIFQAEFILQKHYVYFIQNIMCSTVLYKRPMGYPCNNPMIIDATGIHKLPCVSHYQFFNTSSNITGRLHYYYMNYQLSLTISSLYKHIFVFLSNYDLNVSFLRKPVIAITTHKLL